MTPRLITPPEELAVSLDSAKRNLGIDGAYLDEAVTDWVQGVTQYAEGYMRRALVTQGWRVALDSFPDVIELPFPPAISVESLKVKDFTGTLQLIDPTKYLVDTIAEQGYVTPLQGQAWPATYGAINSVVLEYTCGYGPDNKTVPAAIKLYLLAKLREQFDPSVRMERDTVQSSFLDRLLDDFTVYA